MKHMKNTAGKWITGTICLAMVSMLGAAPAWAQGEKRTVYTEHDFRWQGHLKAGQTLEVINQNGQIEAGAAIVAEFRPSPGQGDGLGTGRRLTSMCKSRVA